MTITLTHYDTTHSITTSEDGLTATEAVDLVLRLLLAAGYHRENVVEAMLAVEA